MKFWFLFIADILGLHYAFFLLEVYHFLLSLFLSRVLTSTIDSHVYIDTLHSFLILVIKKGLVRMVPFFKTIIHLVIMQSGLNIFFRKAT